MNVATTERIERQALDGFLADKRKYILVTTRADGRPQLSPVTGALSSSATTTDRRLLISSYPTRAKVKNLRRNGDCAVCVLSDDFDGPWTQLYGQAQVLEGDEGVEALVEYYRAAAGEHDDWEEYRQAMRDRNKVCVAVTITDWGPIATGGVPPEYAEE